MKWNITFFSEKVEAETHLFPSGILANFLHTTEMIEEYGPMLGPPYTKSLGEGCSRSGRKGKKGSGVSSFVAWSAKRW